MTQSKRLGNRLNPTMGSTGFVGFDISFPRDAPLRYAIDRLGNRLNPTYK